MDIFNFCWMTLLDESKKCCVFFDKNTCNVRNDIYENFNKPVNRISYLYKFGSYNISFFHQCFNEFFTKTPDSSRIIDNFRSIKNLTVCSMSTGPGTDIIGLLYSLHLINKPLINPAAFKIISRYGSWRCVVSEMISSSIISVPDASTCKLIECDFLKDLSKKTQSYLKAADILLMCNSFSSSIIPEKVILCTLKRIIQVLKPGALVFFISSKEKSAYFRELELDSYGSFLFGPVEITLEDMPYNEKIAEIVGVKPLCSGRSLFAVWQKLHEANFQNETENNLTTLHLSTKSIQSKCDKLDANSPILGIADLKGEFSNYRNVSPTDCIASSSQISSSNISSQIIEKKDGLFVSKNSTDFTETNTCTKSLNTFGSVMRQKNVSPPCGNDLKNEENNVSNIHYFTKTFEDLITKLEGYVTSQESSKVFSDQEKQSYDQHQNMHETHCRCSVKLCQFIKNGVTCCCHSEKCYIDTNVSNCNCSMSNVSNLHRVLPQDGPCIIIPIQSLSNESLVKILSIISQDTSSANKTASNLLPKRDNS